MSELETATPRRPTIIAILLVIVRVYLVLYIVVLVGLFLLEKKLIFPTSHGMARTPDMPPFALAYEDLYLRVDGETTNAWYVPGEPGQCVILFSRGNGGTLSDWIEMVQLFHGLGCSVLTYDYGGYGKSTGTPSEARCYADVRAMWRFLTEERTVAPDRIVVIGHSLGGGVTAQLASEVKPGGVVLQSTFVSMPRLFQERMPFFYLRPFVRTRFDTAGKMARISCPVLIVHSPDDRLVPFRNGRELFELAHEPKQFLQIRGSHNEGVFASEKEYTAGLAAFLGSLCKARIAPET